MSYKTGPEYVDHLLILRGLCSLGVIFPHCVTLIPLPFNLKEFAGTSHETWGRIVCSLWPITGVPFVFIFIVLSGYLMGKVYWLKKYYLNWSSIVDFYKNDSN